MLQCLQLCNHMKTTQQRRVCTHQGYTPGRGRLQQRPGCLPQVGLGLKVRTNVALHSLKGATAYNGKYAEINVVDKMAVRYIIKPQERVHVCAIGLRHLHVVPTPNFCKDPNPG